MPEDNIKKIIIPGRLEPAPIGKNGKPKLRFEVRMRQKNGALQKAIFIGGELLDWSVDISSLMEAQRMGPQYFNVVKQDIQRHFVGSVSEFIGRKVTVEEIQEATKTGWI